MEWTNNQVWRELGKIRALRAVKSAYIQGNFLHVTTRRLKHRLRTFGVNSIVIRIPIAWQDVSKPWWATDFAVAYKHVSSWPFGKHPRLNLSTVNGYRCVGENGPDYYAARKIGPHMTVIQQLAMLQTIY